MSGVKRGGASKKSSVVYQRKDCNDTLWDDADLIRLWNAQLEKDRDADEGSQNQNDAIPAIGTVCQNESENEDEDDDGDVSSGDDDGDVVPTSDEEEQEEATASSSKETAQRPPALSAKSANGVSDMLSELPEDIRRVAMAYYRAGFEAGYYIGGRKRPRRSSTRKRPRD